MSYSPTLGRFVTRDPIGYADGANLYEAVSSNPINRVDPLGTTSIRLGAAIAAYTVSQRLKAQAEARAITEFAQEFDRKNNWAWIDKDCDQQATALQKALRKNFADSDLWSFTTVEGAWFANPLSFHNVTVIRPKAGNPMEPWIIDTWTAVNDGFLIETWHDFSDSWRPAGDSVQRQRYFETDQLCEARCGDRKGHIHDILPPPKIPPRVAQQLRQIQVGMEMDGTWGGR
ncbi:MAG: RHS repeat-associated core domain-containing protein [Phycisphaerae bacterium]